MEEEEDTCCVKCYDKFFDCPFFELLSPEQHDNHRVCVACFGNLQAHRGCQPHFGCPAKDCGAKITGHCCHKKRVRVSRQRGLCLENELTRGPAIYIDRPSDVEDPIRSFSNKPNDFRKENMVIAAAWPVDLMEKNSGTTGPGKQQIRTMNVTVPFKIPANSYDSATKTRLIYLMTLLYHVYVHPEEKSFDFQKLNLASMHDLDGPVLNDESMFTCLLYTSDAADE